MFSDTFQLEFLSPKNEDLPHPPIVRVKLASFSLDKQSALPIITPNCIGQEEFEGQIQKMVEELLAIKAQARRKYAAFERGAFERT